MLIAQECVSHFVCVCVFVYLKVCGFISHIVEESLSGRNKGQLCSFVCVCMRTQTIWYGKGDTKLLYKLAQQFSICLHNYPYLFLTRLSLFFQLLHWSIVRYNWMCAFISAIVSVYIWLMLWSELCVKISVDIDFFWECF